MEIGDTVRFLNDVGGGKVTAFRPGGIILVEDKDGFDDGYERTEQRLCCCILGRRACRCTGWNAA